MKQGKPLTFDDKANTDTTRSIEQSRSEQLRITEEEQQLNSEYLSETNDPLEVEDFDLDGVPWNELPEEVQDY